MRWRRQCEQDISWRSRGFSAQLSLDFHSAACANRGFLAQLSFSDFLLSVIAILLVFELGWRNRSFSAHLSAIDKLSFMELVNKIR